MSQRYLNDTGIERPSKLMSKIFHSIGILHYIILTRFKNWCVVKSAAQMHSSLQLSQKPECAYVPASFIPPFSYWIMRCEHRRISFVEIESWARRLRQSEGWTFTNSFINYFALKYVKRDSTKANLTLVLPRNMLCFFYYK